MGKYSRCGTPRGADVGAAQVLATGQPAGAKIDFKSAIIGIAVGFAISASFLVLKICRIRKHLFDNDSSKQRSTNVGFNGQEIMLSPISTFA
ncbi:transmembrane protein 273 isoform X5 [Physeter macrocephalus]|uniref:Transmembrane protein 273 isoform X5 n=1 Tax=Physeter macrocephalus TaxID=9755 RepID=A0A455AZY2_PHYMC|nr:transmembrane protein 273 isoform X5 [Physeter catodon]|eukprot:XP_028342097.1 transmembrane protein 273 isoform X7 [Physeter catodon]